MLPHSIISLSALFIMVVCYDYVFVGGSVTISMINSNMDIFFYERLADDSAGIYFPIGMTVEVVAKRYDVSREQQDEYAFESQMRTAAAQQSGGYDDEIIPMQTKMLLTNKETGDSEEIDCTVDKDECNRPETTLEGLSSLKPVFDPENGSVTAGNSSQLSDGASVTLVMSEDKAKDLGFKPNADFRGFTTLTCEPDAIGHETVYSDPKLLRKEKI